MKFFLRPAGLILAALIVSLTLSACGEKTPEQIAAENRKKTSLAVTRSQVLLFEKKAKDAISMLEKTNAECGASVEICEALAYAYSQDERPAEAAVFFEKASDLKSGDTEFLLNAAKSYEQGGADESAVRAYLKYLKLKNGDALAHRSLGATYERLDKPQDALNEYLAAIKASGRNPNTGEATKIGLLFVKVGNAVQGRMWLEASWKATIPENAGVRKEILAGLITVYLAQKETALLEDAVKKIDAIDPAYISINYPDLRAKLDEFEKNLQSARDALKAGEIKKKQKELAKAEAEEKAKLEAEAKAKEEAEKKAKAEAEENERKISAENAAKSADAPAGEFAAATEGKPVAEIGLKDIDESGKVEDLKATPFEKYMAQTYTALLKNDGEGAQKAAHLAIAENRDSSEAWRTLAKAYEMSEKYNDSYLASKQALSLNPDDINATLFYLRNASRIQSNEKFLNSLYSAHEKFPSNPEVLIGLARTYRAIGDVRNAKFFFKSFVDITPKEHPLYKEISDEYAELLATGK